MFWATVTAVCEQSIATEKEETILASRGQMRILSKSRLTNGQQATKLNFPFDSCDAHCALLITHSVLTNVLIICHVHIMPTVYHFLRAKVFSRAVPIFGRKCHFLIMLRSEMSKRSRNFSLMWWPTACVERSGMWYCYNIDRVLFLSLIDTLRHKKFFVCLTQNALCTVWHVLFMSCFTVYIAF